jgi:hypothetical protein
VKPLANNPYQEFEVREALHAETRRVRFRYELLNHDYSHKKWLEGVERGGEITHNFLADIKRTCRLTMEEAPDIDFLVDMLKVWMGIEMPDGGWADYPQGVFLMSSRDRKWDGFRTTRAIEGYDLSQVLVEDKIDSRYTVHRTTNVVDAVETLLDTTFVAHDIIPSEDIMPATRQWEPGTPKRQIVNDLLESINYEALYFDSNGVGRSAPYVTPSDAEPEYTYITDDTSIILPMATNTLDLFNVPNKFVLTISQPDRDPITSVYVNNEYHSPTSYMRRGRYIVDFREDEDAATKAILDKRAKRIAAEASQVFEQAEFETALMPHHEHGDILTLAHSDLDVAGQFRETGWRMRLQPGATMTHEVRRVVVI